MKITIACVGKIKEKYLTAGIEEFSKRLTPFCKLETLAINEERMPDNPSPAEKQQVLERKFLCDFAGCYRQATEQPGFGGKAG